MPAGLRTPRRSYLDAVRKKLQSIKLSLRWADMKKYATVAAFVFLSYGTCLCATPPSDTENTALKDRIAKLERQTKELEMQMRLEREIFAKTREENRELRREIRRLKRNAVEAKISAPVEVSDEKPGRTKRENESDGSLNSLKSKKINDDDAETSSGGFKMFPF